MPSTKPRRQATEGTFLPKPDTTDKVIAGTQMVAGALGTFGALAPVPFIKEAAEAATYVAQIVKDVKNNQEEFKFIAQDAHHFVDKINQACTRVHAEEGKLPGDLVLDLKDFVDTLNKIKGFAEANTHRRTFTRFFYKDLDPENIRRCREELANRFQTFAIQSSIQSRADLAAIRSDTKKILANQEDHRASSENNIADASMLSPPPMSPMSPTRQRPTSAPPTHQQFSPLPSPSFSDTSDDPFAHMRHPGFPFNTPSQRQSQPVFNVTTNSNFNAPNSNVYNSGTVNTHFNVGSDNYGTTVNNYNYDGSSSVDRKMKKAERKVARKVGSPSSAQWMDDSNNQQGYYASRRGTD